MNFVQAYEQAIAQHKIEDDPHQRQVLPVLQTMYDALLAPKPWYDWFWPQRSTLRGLYVYGPVGAGKTWLMDLFYHALPPSMVYRAHGHAFMQSIDAQLRRWQGHADPLKVIARRLSRHIRVLCLDEFMVHDMTQARLWVTLLTELLAQGVILVATSNTAPQHLYQHGINREQFLPVIELIQTHCDVIAMQSTTDHRLHADAINTDAWFLLPDVAADALERAFFRKEPTALGPGEICIQHRDIPYRAQGQKTIWFEFRDLCQIPRCQLDYLELASRFEHIFLSNVPSLVGDETSGLILLMYLVDVLYDQHAQLSISSHWRIQQLYPEGPMKTQFARTESRLIEMGQRHYARH